MSEVILHETRRGVLAHFAADQCLGLSLQRYGEWAEDEIALLKTYVPVGGTVLDVGANVGSHTLAFAEMVGREGRVVSIEGQPEVLDLLGYNVVANNLVGTVRIISALAGSSLALVPYTVKNADRNPGAKSFVNEVHKPSERLRDGNLEVHIALIPLDSLVLGRCDLIKIDVEGMEFDVLDGAKRTLELCRPVIYFEHASGDIAVIGRITELLRSFGYRLYWHVANPYSRNNFKEDEYNIFGGSIEINVLAVQAEHFQPTLPELIDPSVPPERPTLDQAKSGVVITYNPKLTNSVPAVEALSPAMYASELEKSPTVGVEQTSSKELLRVVARRLLRRFWM